MVGRFGRWNGRRILTAQWCRRATSPHKSSEASRAKYGYLWWVFDYPHKGRTLRAFFASGNGGQHAIGILELDLVSGLTEQGQSFWTQTGPTLDPGRQ